MPARSKDKTPASALEDLRSKVKLAEAALERAQGRNDTGRLQRAQTTLQEAKQAYEEAQKAVANIFKSSISAQMTDLQSREIKQELIEQVKPPILPVSSLEAPLSLDDEDDELPPVDGVRTGYSSPLSSIPSERAFDDEIQDLEKVLKDDLAEPNPMKSVNQSGGLTTASQGGEEPMNVDNEHIDSDRDRQSDGQMQIDKAASASDLENPQVMSKRGDVPGGGQEPMNVDNERVDSDRDGQSDGQMQIDKAATASDLENPQVMSQRGDVPGGGEEPMPVDDQRAAYTHEGESDGQMQIEHGNKAVTASNLAEVQISIGGGEQPTHIEEGRAGSADDHQAGSGMQIDTSDRTTAGSDAAAATSEGTEKFDQNIELKKLLEGAENCELYRFEMPDIKVENVEIGVDDRQELETFASLKELLEDVLRTDGVATGWKNEKTRMEQRQMDWLVEVSKGMDTADIGKRLLAMRGAIEHVLRVDRQIMKWMKKWRNAKRRLVAAAEAEIESLETKKTKVLEMMKKSVMSAETMSETMRHGQTKAYAKNEKRVEEMSLQILKLKALVEAHALPENEGVDEETEAEDDEQDEMDEDDPASKKRKRGKRVGGTGGKSVKFNQLDDDAKAKKLDTIKASYDKYRASLDVNDLNDTFSRTIRSIQEVLPESSYTSEEMSMFILSTNKGQGCCVFHDKYQKKMDCDNVIEFKGVGYRPQKKASSKATVEQHQKGHLHCGCLASDAVLELFFWKTARARSTNPEINASLERLGKSPWFKMPAQIQNPVTRAFWHESLRNFSGLENMDFIGIDFGLDSYAIKIAVKQLYAQVSRLNALGVHVGVNFDVGPSPVDGDSDAGGSNGGDDDEDEAVPGLEPVTARKGKGKGKESAAVNEEKLKTTKAAAAYEEAKSRVVPALFMVDPRDE